MPHQTASDSSLRIASSQLQSVSLTCLQLDKILKISISRIASPPRVARVRGLFYRVFLLHSSTLQYLQASNLGITEIAGLMGSDTTVSALKSEILERTKAIGKHQIYMKTAGQDPAQIDISSFDSRKSRQGQML